MDHIEASDIEGKLDQLLDRVESGAEISIMRGGRMAARLVPPSAATIDREKARRAAARIKAMSKGVTLGGLSIADLIDEGRR